MPNFKEMLQSIFTNSSRDKPDFVLKSKNSATSIFLDKATKLDIILSTVYNINEGNVETVDSKENTEDEKSSKGSELGLKHVESSEEERKEKLLKN